MKGYEKDNGVFRDKSIAEHKLNVIFRNVPLIAL